MRFRYTGYTRDGSPVRGTVEATSRAAALDTALGGAFVLTRLAPDSPRGRVWQALTRQRGRLRPAEVAQFLRQTGGAVSTGVPVATALDLQRQHARGRRRGVLHNVHAAVISGRTLSEALEAQRAFPALTVRVIRAGEAAGDLASACRRAAVQLETEASLRGKVARAMVYPSILFALLLAGGTVLAGFVFPRLLPVLQGLNAALPLPTRVLTTVTGLVEGHWRLLFALAGAAGMGLALLLNTNTGQAARDTLVWSLPLLGPVTRSAAIARFCRTLATLLRTATPLQEVVDLLAASTGSRHAQAHLLLALRRVLAGADLTDALAAAGVLPPLAVQALATGAAVGALAEAADQTATYYEEVTNAAVMVLTESLTPLVTVLFALVVLFFALAVYLPLVSILKHIR